ncbi:hypothetical protein BG006_009737 [Podila minutissima]|uniref:Uncharacterized protein n=1 Tax=Podila minutissima TaxID=64525 RepID=A0A9P5SEN3_9FUNG|nr:hypothetical protein BG006_009737 [Podila minutissima]
MSTTSPSPIPFLILGLVTGGALLYVSYWVWPPSQRRNTSNNLRNNRGPNRRQGTTIRRTATSNNNGSSSSTGGLRRSNATRRSRQPVAARRDDSRHYRSDGSSSDDGETSGYTTSRTGMGGDSDDNDASDREYGTLDEDGYEKLPMDGSGKHDGLQLMNLLYAIAEDQAGKGGITCNSCRTVPIRGLRYKCANCQDYDLCEGCEAAEVHIKSHVFMKIRIPIPPLANSRTKKLPPFYPGTPQGSTATPEYLLHELLQKTHFDNVELDAMYSQYLSLSTLTQDGGGITRPTFEQALGPLGLEKNLITSRIFHFFDQDDDGIINFKEMACGLSVLCKGNFDEKIDFAFQGYDLDGDGYISREELYEMFKAYFYLSMELIRDVVKTMENDLMNNFEYQPGMPISSTFTAPIPREIGVRNSRSEERRRTRERAPLPAEWSLTIIPNENSTSTPGTQPSSAGSNEGSDNLGTNGAETATESTGPTANTANTAREDPDRDNSDDLLPSGTYGLVGQEEFADEEEGDDENEEGGNDDVHQSDLGDMPELERVDGSDSEVLVSPNEHEANSASEAEDSGVDSSGWQANVLQDSMSSSQSIESSSSQLHAIDTVSSSASSPPSPTHAHTASNILNIAAPPLSQPPPAEQISEGVSGTSNGSSGSSRSNNNNSSSGSRHNNSSGSGSRGNNNTSSSSSRSRPRKDQPLPPTTSSPYMTASTSNTYLPWDCYNAHEVPSTSASQQHNHASSSAPSLAPAFAIGFGLQNGAPSNDSSRIEPTTSTSSAPGRRNSAQAQGGQPSRRPSMGSRFQSYASSSSMAPSGSYANTSYFSSTFPVMESISQGAIQEMVDKTFAAIKNPSRPGYITLDEFRAHVLTDAGILGWFDALGSIF